MIHEQEPEIVTRSTGNEMHCYPIYRHLSNCEDLDLSPTSQLQIYVFQHEDLKDELGKAIKEYRGEYVFSTGIVFPDWLEGRVEDLSAETLQSLEYKMELGYKIAPSDIEKIRSNR